MARFPFLKIDPAQTDQNVPALVRFATFEPGGELVSPADLLSTYPRLSLYGGPARKTAFETAQGKALRRAWEARILQRFGKFSASELVPVAPSNWPIGSSAPTYPLQWRWLWVQEQRPQTLHRLTRLRPGVWDWRSISA